MVVTLGQQYNIGEKPTVILYSYINRHAGTPEKQRKQNSTSSNNKDESNTIIIETRTEDHDDVESSLSNLLLLYGSMALLSYIITSTNFLIMYCK